METPEIEKQLHRELIPNLHKIEKTHRSQAMIVHRYLTDMKNAIGTIRRLLKDRGTLIIVCGDNLVGGHKITTWQAINRLIGLNGFHEFDCFGDLIERRYVPPKRQGHKGLIKREVITAFRAL